MVHKRVMGELAISRAIGDSDFKEKDFKLVLADPEVVEETVRADDEFLVLACDGMCCSPRQFQNFMHSVARDVRWMKNQQEREDGGSDMRGSRSSPGSSFPVVLSVRVFLLSQVSTT